MFFCMLINSAAHSRGDTLQKVYGSQQHSNGCCVNPALSGLAGHYCPPLTLKMVGSLSSFGFDSSRRLMFTIWRSAGNNRREQEEQQKQERQQEEQ